MKTASDHNETTLQITPMGAARRQLATALDLWINDADVVSIHTLLFSAHQIIHDINRQRKGPPLLLDSDRIKPEMRKEWVNLMKEPANFFKHADGRKSSKRPATLEFQPRINTLLFGLTFHALNGLGEKLSSQEAAFQVWQGVHHPNLLTKESQSEILARVSEKGLATLRTLTKRQFFAMYELAEPKAKSALRPR